ncbi:MAG: hypothetical protein JWQ57_1431 [Mucilaginibacter sp.]|nr:hypothetical protein [Mucilaginibacter sp.]
MALFYFLSKATACMGIFYCLYYTLFRRLTFFTLNRWYLLSSLLISILIPAIHFEVLRPLPFHTSLPAAAKLPAVVNYNEFDNTNMHAATAHINIQQLILYAYFIVCAVLLIKILTGIAVIIYKAARRGRKTNGYYLITNASKSNSSFFNFVFLKDEKITTSEKDQVLAHELQHVRLVHSADQLFTELLKAFFWFNPFIYLIAKELQQVHEFEVDKNLTSTYHANEYAQLILKLYSTPASAISNQFSAYRVKSRIRMLFQAHSSTKFKLRYLWAIPVISLMIYQFSLEKSYATTRINGQFTLVLDAGHDGSYKGVICGKVYEKDITLALAQQIKLLAEQRGIRTLLTRNNDRHVEFKDRLSYKGDVFASIHINAAPAGPTQQNANGIEVKDNPQGQNPGLSARVADQLKNSFKQLNGINTNDSTFAKPGVYVLRENTVPAVLIEFGYATNPHDLEYILNEQHRYELAEKFVDAIVAYNAAKHNYR